MGKVRVRWMMGVWLLVATPHDCADIATLTGCFSALAAHQDQWEWQAEAVPGH